MKQRQVPKLLLAILAFCLVSYGTEAARLMENLDRGLVAVHQGGSQVYVGWRMLGTEPDTISFNIYRDSVLITPSPITDSTNYIDNNGSLSSTYRVASVINGTEDGISEPVVVWAQQYLEVPLQVPAGVTTPDGVTCSYSPNDASVGDVDGDGQYEIILKWDPSNSQDNSISGYTGNVYLDAYEMDGTFLWRIDLGVNIRAGAHYTQFIVYDLDSDGYAEVACRTSDGTVDGVGTVIGDPDADYRETSGYILTGPEYLTIFNGQTGQAMVSTDFYPNRVHVNQWGDNYGNRCDRFLAGVAYVDGQQPTLVMARGYYGPRSGYSARNEIVAYNWRDDTLSQVWYFKAHTDGPNSNYIGQGCHSLSVADVDDDGKDEIIYGACTIDDDGTGLYSTGLGHGDALHVSDMDPDRPGLEVWQCQENSPYGATFRDAATGEVIFRQDASKDTGRACAGDITADYRGYEVWAGTGVHLYSSDGEDLGTHSNPINFMVWWDGDLLREFLNSNVISKYGSGTLLEAGGCSSNNSTKSTPCLSADILGDWREEVIWRTSDNQSLRIYTTTNITSHRIRTLMHDSQYRQSIAWQNTAYNQPPHPSFYLGEGMFDSSKGVLRERWMGIAGNAVSDLTAGPDYPDNPTEWNYLSRLESSVNQDETYGTRLRGYLIPPTEGLYTFWVAADDSAELWLSTDATVDKAVLIASVSSWTNPLQWDKYASQQSVNIALSAGHKYYFELLHKEGTGGDHYAVAWQGPGLSRQVVENTYLMPYQDIYYGEFTDNTYVDLNDFTAFADYWLQQDCAFELSIDITGDCIVNGSDFAIFAQNWLAGSLVSTIQIQENEAGYVGVYEGSIDSDNTGYTGSGFVNTNNLVDQYIEWTVEASQTGDYDLQWRFANGSTTNRTGAVVINNTRQVTGLDLDGTGSWSTWQLSSVVTVTLTKGTNTIQLVAENASGLANIDWIEITGAF